MGLVFPLARPKGRLSTGAYATGTLRRQIGFVNVIDMIPFCRPIANAIGETHVVGAGKSRYGLAPGCRPDADPDGTCRETA
jgi:hypothetical protein